MPITLDPNLVWRDWLIPGVPDVGSPYKPKKLEIRQLLSEYQQSIIALEAKNQGTSLPNLLIRWTITTVNPNTITAEAQVTPPAAGLALNVISFQRDNTDEVTINGKPLLSNTAKKLKAGYLKTGMMALFFDHGDHWRLLSDYATYAIVEGAEKARDYAARWASDPEDAEPIDDGKNPLGQSSYHWAKKSEQYAENIGDAKEMAEKAAQDAKNTLEAANAGFTGFVPGNIYDEGHVTDELIIFNRDEGLVSDVA